MTKPTVVTYLAGDNTVADCIRKQHFNGWTHISSLEEEKNLIPRLNLPFILFFFYFFPCSPQPLSLTTKISPSSRAIRCGSILHI